MAVCAKQQMTKLVDDGVTQNQRDGSRRDNPFGQRRLELDFSTAIQEFRRAAQRKAPLSFRGHLFVSHRCHGIDFGGAPRGQITSRQCHADQHQNYGDKRRRVGGFRAVKQPRHQAGQD
jgi:hypothetical protein